MSLFQINFPNIGDIVTAIVNGIQSLMEWLWNNIINSINSLINFIWNFIYENIINPIRSFLETALNKFLSKLEGIIYITLTVPLMVKEVKDFVEEPSLKKGLFILAKPFLTYLGAKILAGTIRPYLQPVSIPPTAPPSPPSIPKFYEIKRYYLDYITLSDEFKYVMGSRLSPLLADVISINDVASIYMGWGVKPSETINISDLINVYIGGKIISSIDTVNISDVLTINISPTAYETWDFLDATEVSNFPTFIAPDTTAEWVSPTYMHVYRLASGWGYIYRQINNYASSKIEVIAKITVSVWNVTYDKPVISFGVGDGTQFADVDVLVVAGSTTQLKLKDNTSGNEITFNNPNDYMKIVFDFANLKIQVYYGATLLAELSFTTTSSTNFLTLIQIAANEGTDTKFDVMVDKVTIY